MRLRRQRMRSGRGASRVAGSVRCRWDCDGAVAGGECNDCGGCVAERDRGGEDRETGAGFVDMVRAFGEVEHGEQCGEQCCGERDGAASGKPQSCGEGQGRDDGDRRSSPRLDIDAKYAFDGFAGSGLGGRGPADFTGFVPGFDVGFAGFVVGRAVRFGNDPDDEQRRGNREEHGRNSDESPRHGVRRVGDAIATD